MSSVRVAVRCRPFNERERQLGSECIVAMQGNSTLLSVPADRAGASSSSGKAPEPRTFNFDHSFWSHDPADPHFADQAMVYKAIGSVVMADALEGYHSCVFAYGQTGAGKSFSMMGGADQGEQRGLIPRLCEDLFGHIRDNTDATWSAKCEVSYMEIYNERVRDLLNPSNQRKLRVREHATTGPYVEDLSFHAVDNFDMVKALMEEGNKVCCRVELCICHFVFPHLLILFSTSKTKDANRAGNVDERCEQPLARHFPADLHPEQGVARGRRDHDL